MVVEGIVYTTAVFRREYLSLYCLRQTEIGRKYKSLSGKSGWGERARITVFYPVGTQRRVMILRMKVILTTLNILG